MFAYEGTVYEVGPLCQTIYPASGNSVDWGYTGGAVKYSFTNELRDGGHPNVFIVDPEDIEPNGEEMLAFHRVVARWIADEYNQ